MTEQIDQMAQLAAAGAPEPLRIRLSRAMASIGRLRKDGHNRDQNYAFLSEAAIKDAVQRALAAEALFPCRVSFEILERREVVSKHGKVGSHYDVACHVEFRENGDLVQLSGVGSGADYGDKALMKAQTAAHRELWRAAFCIPAGTDPERYPEESIPVQGRPTQPEPDKASPLNPDTIKALGVERKRLGMTPGEVASVIRARTGGPFSAMTQEQADAFLVSMKAATDGDVEAMRNNMPGALTS